MAHPEKDLFVDGRDGQLANVFRQPGSMLQDGKKMRIKTSQSQNFKNDNQVRIGSTR